MNVRGIQSDNGFYSSWILPCNLKKDQPFERKSHLPSNLHFQLFNLFVIIWVGILYIPPVFPCQVHAACRDTTSQAKNNPNFQIFFWTDAEPSADCWGIKVDNGRMTFDFLKSAWYGSVSGCFREVDLDYKSGETYKYGIYVAEEVTSPYFKEI